MHVHIHADAGLVEALGHHQVGGLAAHARKREQGVDLVRHRAPEALDQVAADLAQHPRLGAVEAHRVDGLFYPRGLKGEHLARRVGKREQPPRGELRRLILGTQAEDARDQHLVRVAVPGHHRNGRGLPGLDRLPYHF